MDPTTVFALDWFLWLLNAALMGGMLFAIAVAATHVAEVIYKWWQMRLESNEMQQNVV